MSGYIVSPCVREHIKFHYVRVRHARAHIEPLSESLLAAIDLNAVVRAVLYIVVVLIGMPPICVSQKLEIAFLCLTSE